MTRPKDHKSPAKAVFSQPDRSSPPEALTRQPSEQPAKRSAEVDALIRASVRGDVDAFGELYQLYADTIYRYFFYRVRLDTEAQDLTAQVFLNAWKAIGRFRQEEVPFLVWLYAIARNLLINHGRHNRQQVGMAVLGEGIAEQVEDQNEASNPVRALLRRAENEDLVRAFEQLNEDQQQVIYYRFVENWSHAEVARSMKKSEGAIRALQFRALESLRRLLSAGEVNLG